MFSGTTVLVLAKFSQFSSSELSPQLSIPSHLNVIGISPHEQWKSAEYDFVVVTGWVLSGILVDVLWFGNDGPSFSSKLVDTLDLTLVPMNLEKVLWFF